MSEQTINKDENEIDFVAIGERLKKSFFYIFKRWWIILIAAIVGGVLGIGLSKWYGTKYTTITVFTVQGQSQTSSILNSAMSLASSLGIGGGKSSSGDYNNNFFASLIQSRRVLKESLLEKAVINGSKATLAEHYIRVYEMDKNLFGSETFLSGFTFKHFTLNSITSTEDSVLTIIYAKILDNNLVVNYDDTKPFNVATITTTSQDLSKNLMKHLIDNTSRYYMENIYELNNDNLKIAEFRLDSLSNALKEMDNRVAAMKDNTNNIIKQSGLVALNAAIRDQGLLSVQYSSAVNNYELAKVALITNTPILNVIDDPSFSTEVKYISMIKAIIIGGFLFGFMVAGILWVRFLIVGDISNTQLSRTSDS